ncbi:MAG: putative DNA binding domain-containing protein [Myxococcales bacterium]|nr:putative DNA binding domain-containing protein [Myxococcales bacterium]
MLTDDEIQQLALDLESDRVERKESFARTVRDRVAQAVCAFANDLPDNRAPGIVIIGMRDDGTPSGAAVTDELLLNLGALRSDGKILPLPVVHVRKVEIAGVEMAVIVVTPSPDTPVRFEGRVWIRVGPRRGIASRDEERILVEKRQAGDLAFDQSPVRGATPEDLDLEFFRSTYLPAAVSPEVLEENERPIERQLAALHLLAPTGDPNAAAVLLLGRDPSAWFPSSTVQFVRFDGDGLADPILDQKDLSGRQFPISDPP